MQKLRIHALVPFLLSAIADVALLFSGYSYRFLFYESLLCLILFQSRFANILLFSAVLLLKVLYVFFSINIFSFLWISLQPVFVTTSVTVVSVVALYFSRNLSILLFIASVSVTVFIDKQLIRDRFAGSILHTSFHSAIIGSAVPIDSEVHELLLESLRKGPTILINWESLGVPTDPLIIKKLLQQHKTLNYKVIKVPPRATISSEFEYLCARTFGKIDEQVICSPHQQSSIALHGNIGVLFNRKNLYPALGFQSFNFMESIPGDTCFFSFRGKCDSAVFENVIKLANRKSAQFIYALTLDSHFPYAKYTHHAEELWQEVNDFLLKYKREGLSYNLIIVGDHPPPLSVEFYSDQVPLFYMPD